MSNPRDYYPPYDCCFANCTVIWLIASQLTAACPHGVPAMSVDRYGIPLRPELQAVPSEYVEVRTSRCFGSMAVFELKQCARTDMRAWPQGAAVNVAQVYVQVCWVTTCVHYHACCSGVQEYVKARLLQFVGEPVFAKRMYQTVEGVQRVAREVLTELSVPAGNSLQDGVSGAYSLQFRHECRSIPRFCSSTSTRAVVYV